MRAKNLSSSMIKRVAFDDEAQTLSVWFRDTGRYIYHGVPRAVYDGLCKASSAGRVFNAWVKGRYHCHFDPDRRRFGPKADRARNIDPSCELCREQETKMADNKSKRGGGDRQRVAGGEGYEIGYFARKHGISRDQAEKLIKRVGNDREKLNQAAQKLKAS
jgi:hypothetical protein